MATGVDPRKYQLGTEAMSAEQRAEHVERRACRPGVLRPWVSECLMLRAGDDRIRGRTVARGGPRLRASGDGLRVRQRRTAGDDENGAWRQTTAAMAPEARGGAVERDGEVLRVVGMGEAERIGLWGALDRLRGDSWGSERAKRARARGGSREETVAVELVRIDAGVIRRACWWPKLPKRCTVAGAARRLGVHVGQVKRWLRKGWLVSRRVKRRKGRGRWNDRRVEVSYRRASWATEELTGASAYYPEQARRLMCQMPFAKWAARQFESEGRAEHVVRVEVVRGRGEKTWKPIRHWVCPVCGRLAQKLYLPAGRMARAGRTFAAWRFQCWRCTGVGCESGTWTGHWDAMGQWALKMTVGAVSGNEWRKSLSVMAGEQADDELLGASERLRTAGSRVGPGDPPYGSGGAAEGYGRWVRETSAALEERRRRAVARAGKVGALPAMEAKVRRMVRNALDSSM